MFELENNKKIAMDKQKDLGLVLTPSKTADYIVSKLMPFSSEEMILDPCVGPGIFIQSLLNHGLKKSQIYAFDINPEYQKKMNNYGVKFEVKDFILSYSPLFSTKFDIILGNPPYLNKASPYIRKNRDKLKKLYGKINAHETYSMFIVSSIWRLRNGGKLAFITSDSFLTLNSHTKLRSFILKSCKIIEILLAPKSLFDNQNVSTSTVIIILEKCSGKENRIKRFENIMRVIPRVKSEDDYFEPEKIYKFKQMNYHLLPFNIFFTDVEKQIVELFEKSPKLENFIRGYIGMHTHNNVKYIAAIEGSELADLFKKKNSTISNPTNKYKIISRELLDTGNWKPYLKRGGGDQYYRPVLEALDWNPESIPIYDIPKNVEFEKEGIVISGVSSHLAARYMPPGCYWDSNKAIGFLIKDEDISIEYVLGLLNSSLYNYLMNGIINNTNSIQLTGIHALPFIKPDRKIKEEVEILVEKIIDNKKKNLDYDYSNEQNKINNIIYEFYNDKFNFSNELKKLIDEKFSNLNKL